MESIHEIQLKVANHLADLIMVASGDENDSEGADEFAQLVIDALGLTIAGASDDGSYTATLRLKSVKEVISTFTDPQGSE